MLPKSKLLIWLLLSSMNHQTDTKSTNITLKKTEYFPENLISPAPNTISALRFQPNITDHGKNKEPPGSKSDEQTPMMELFKLSDRFALHQQINPTKLEKAL